MFRRSRNITLNVGTNFSLTCLITPNTTGVDTSYSVQSIITGPGLLYVERVNVSQPTPVGGGVYEAVVTFKHLLEIDEGSYNCSVRVISSLKNVVASDSTSAFVSINVERKCGYRNVQKKVKTFISMCSNSAPKCDCILYTNPNSWTQTYAHLHCYR